MCWDHRQIYLWCSLISWRWRLSGQPRSPELTQCSKYPGKVKYDTDWWQTPLSDVPGPPPSRMTCPPPASRDTRRWRRWRRSQLSPATPGRRSSPGASGLRWALCRVFLDFLPKLFSHLLQFTEQLMTPGSTHKLQGQGYYDRWVRLAQESREISTYGIRTELAWLIIHWKLGKPIPIYGQN